MKTLYLSGPMTGIPAMNFPAFHAIAAQLRSEGYTVLNPAETDNGDTSKPWAYYIRKDIRMVCDADAIVVLPGWQNSKGARIEVACAEAMGMPVLDTDLQPFAESVCEEADRIVSADRQNSYGHPHRDFSRTAKIWSAMLDIEVTPEKVGLCMIAVKMSRLCNAYKRDSVVDIAGYAKTVSMVHEYREARK